MIVTATAAATTSVGIKDSVYFCSSVQNQRNAARISRYNRWINRRSVETPRQLSNARPESRIQVPIQLVAEWLPVVQERVERSVLPQNQENDGSFLSPEVADAGKNFFEMTSDLLPGEPYIYSSGRGDLVSEFEAGNGKLTAITTPDCVVMFAVVDGIPLERKIALGNSRQVTRHEVEVFARMLHQKQHGAVETRS